MKLKVFFDGACSLCTGTMTALRRRDRSGALEFIDITAADFSPLSYGLSGFNLQAAIHCQDEYGHVAAGMAALRRIYQQLGMGVFLNWTGWPLIAPWADRVYRLVARYRPRSSRHSCDNGHCRR